MGDAKECPPRPRSLRTDLASQSILQDISLTVRKANSVNK